MNNQRTRTRMLEAATADLIAAPHSARNQAIIFQNSGEIDIAAVTTLGVSVKEGDTPIGFFGTGLKFAIATILREGGAVTIHSGTTSYTFATDRGEVRGEAFDFVTMDGQRLGFTTQLGRTWQAWMAFRELASNCRDEGGRYFRADGAVPAQGMTTIVVHSNALSEVWPDRESILLEAEPIVSNEFVDIYEGPSDFIYYRGVRVAQHSRPTRLRYNIKHTIKLTEDRTAANMWEIEFNIERGLGAMTDRRLLRQALTCGERYAEHHMDIAAYGNPGATFRELARELTLGSATVANVNPSAARDARELMMKDVREGQDARLEPHQSRMLEKAKAMLAAGGFEIDRFPVLVMDTLGPNICGMARDGRIFISLLPFQKGTREVAATLLEEFAHLRSGAGDCSRDFQNWLFDQLLVNAERAAGEPF